jgi:gamma-glutamylcyclotransferase (GGCT)/AIG2-like uncharacterized protein YtfP
MNRLFVYGIFLGESLRERYGMSNPRYTTVDGWATVGQHIVQAVRVPKGYALTGLLVDVDPRAWPRIDDLEVGYDRIKIVTTDGKQAWMYARKGEKHETE